MPTVPRGFKGGAGGSFRIYAHGADKLGLALQKYNIQTTAKVYDAMKRVILILEADAKRLITSGYYAPAIDTGRLRGSITGQIVRFDAKLIEAKVGSNVYYGIYVHEGTIKMEKRPYMKDALVRNENKIKIMIIKALKRDVGML